MAILLHKKVLSLDFGGLFADSLKATIIQECELLLRDSTT